MKASRNLKTDQHILIGLKKALRNLGTNPCAGSRLHQLKDLYNNFKLDKMPR